MVDTYIIKSQNKEALVNWILVILGLLFLEGVFQLIGSYFSNLLAQSVIHDIRKKLFQHILSFRMNAAASIAANFVIPVKAGIYDPKTMFTPMFQTMAPRTRRGDTSFV